MNKDMVILKNYFEDISKKGWIKSISKGPSGVGATFENEIGLEKNEFEIPDFSSIEIKTKRKYSKAYTTLFNASCDGPYLFEMKRLQTSYGWPDKTFKDSKILNSSIFANQFSSFGYRFNVKLKVDYTQKKLFLNVYDLANKLIDNQSFWSFELLEEKLMRKLKYLAFIEAERKIYNNEEFFHYKNITLYSLKSFDTFLVLIEKGIIRVSIKIGVYKYGNKAGKTYDHGTGFGILADNLYMLFDEIY